MLLIKAVFFLCRALFQLLIYTIEFLKFEKPQKCSVEEEYCFDEQHLRIAVTTRLGYRLDDRTWSAVNEAFGYYWDDVVGLGNEIEYGNMIDTMIRVTNFLEVYISYAEMQKIIDAILDYINNIPGAIY